VTMSDPRTRLIGLLTRLGAVDLAGQVWNVRDVRELPPDVRGQMLDVIGHHAAERGTNMDGTPNQLGRELRAGRGARAGRVVGPVIRRPQSLTGISREWH